MTDAVTAFPGELRIAGEGWSLRAERVEDLGAGVWCALIGVRRGLKLLVTGTSPDQELEVEAWAGEPGESDGVAVIGAADGSARVARVPLCGCGERGCGNAGVQFGRLVAGSELPALVGLLREFPWSEVIPTGSNVLQGDGLAALSEPDNDPPPGGRSYLGVARPRRSRPGSRY
ncbi:MAG: hypothetical protein ACRDMI_11420 [Streptosporangiaceae bacterium]